jgi:hypothetical protein
VQNLLHGNVLPSSQQMPFCQAQPSSGGQSPSASYLVGGVDNGSRTEKKWTVRKVEVKEREREHITIESYEKLRRNRHNQNKQKLQSH